MSTSRNAFAVVGLTTVLTFSVATTTCAQQNQIFKWGRSRSCQHFLPTVRQQRPRHFDQRDKCAEYVIVYRWVCRFSRCFNVGSRKQRTRAIRA